MADDNVVKLWIKFLEYLNGLGFDYYIGQEWIRNRGIYDEDSHRFIAMEQTENVKSYIYYETIRGIYVNRDISFYTVMLRVLPKNYTINRMREAEHYVYIKPKIYPRNKTKMILNEFNKSVMI